MASYHRCLRGRCATTRSALAPDIGYLKYQLCVFAPLAFFVLLSGLIGQFWEGWRKPLPSWRARPLRCCADPMPLGDLVGRVGEQARSSPQARISLRYIFRCLRLPASSLQRRRYPRQRPALARSVPPQGSGRLFGDQRGLHGGAAGRVDRHGPRPKDSPRAKARSSGPASELIDNPLLRSGEGRPMPPARRTTPTVGRRRNQRAGLT